MYRRHFLRSAAAVPLLSVLPRSLLAKPVAGHFTLHRVRPSDPGWPNRVSWFIGMMSRPRLPSLVLIVGLWTRAAALLGAGKFSVGVASGKLN